MDTAGEEGEEEVGGVSVKLMKMLQILFTDEVPPCCRHISHFTSSSTSWFVQTSRIFHGHPELFLWVLHVLQLPHTNHTNIIVRQSGNTNIFLSFCE